MRLEQINKVYFLGIGGIGMSALARYFLSNSMLVCGYDKTESPLTKALEKEGAQIIYEDKATLIPNDFQDLETSLFIYTPAIPADNEIRRHLLALGSHLYKRSEVLGLLSKEYKCIAIAGTHGKTTVSSMCAYILHQSKLGCQAFLGGIMIHNNSNLLSHPNSQWMVVEADEYDRSFLQLHPQIALITAMDADHLDIYGNHEKMLDSFKEFISQIREEGCLIIHQNLKKHFSEESKFKTYALNNSDADYYASNIELKDGHYHFNLNTSDHNIQDIKLFMPGMINLENAIAAAASAIEAGVDHGSIKKALAEFKGIKRRMELIVKNEALTFYDDYAHHPEEINAALSSLKSLYPDKELTVIFQPHLYTRTRDFAEGFGKSLSLADELILLDIYPAREKPIEGVHSTMILEHVQNTKKQILNKEELANYIKSINPELLVTLGAGDIDRMIEPLKNILK